MEKLFAPSKISKGIGEWRMGECGKYLVYYNCFELNCKLLCILIIIINIIMAKTHKDLNVYKLPIKFVTKV